MSALVLGAGRVIAIDTVKERLALARRLGAETVDYADGSVHEQILDMTDRQGPDAVIDAVGMESMGSETTMQKLTSTVQSTSGSMPRAAR